MGSTSVDIDEPIATVWAGIIDAEHYPDWLIGAQKVEAPADWPRRGASFTHRIGVGPLALRGSTTARLVTVNEHFEIDAGMGPLGEARVSFDLEPLDRARTRVAMTERPSAGLVAIAERYAGALVHRLIDYRNAESLRRLSDGVVRVDQRQSSQHV